MTDQPAKPRRRWKRWTALGLVLAIGCGLWMAKSESGTLRRARALQLDMTEEQVKAVMLPSFAVVSSSHPGGVARTGIYATQSEYRALLLKGSCYSVLARVGLGELIGPPKTEVAIEFGPDGRVIWFRRGSEVVGR